MNKNTKKYLALSVTCMFVFMLSLSAVSAWTFSTDDKSTGVNAPIENPEWLLSGQKFFGLGESWADFIVAIAVILMVFAAAYDILGFTAFEKDWVKYSIAGAVAVVFGVTGGVGAFAVGIMKLAGGSIMLATGFSIVAAAFFFFLGSFFKSKRKVFAAKKTVKEAGAGFDKAAEGVKGAAKLTDAAAKSVIIRP